MAYLSLSTGEFNKDLLTKDMLSSQAVTVLKQYGITVAFEGATISISLAEKVAIVPTSDIVSSVIAFIETCVPILSMEDHVLQIWVCDIQDILDSYSLLLGFYNFRCSYPYIGCELNDYPQYESFSACLFIDEYSVSFSIGKSVLFASDGELLIEVEPVDIARSSISGWLAVFKKILTYVLDVYHVQPNKHELKKLFALHRIAIDIPS